MADINVGAISEALNNKMDLDGNNVIASAGASFRNTTNWSNNMTNCITYIPQDINLELNNGTLTLKAGSKVYVPNGVGVFDELVIQNDLTLTITANSQHEVFVNSDGSGLQYRWINLCNSGTSDTGLLTTSYNTSTNIITAHNSGGDIQVSFPVGVVTVSNDAISSIDQVFNGFGYIGSIVFALPGVKGLIPNGRNKDGTLKNIETTVLTVQTVSGGAPDQKNIYANVRPEGTLGLNGEFKYDEKNNITYNGVNIEPQFLIAKFDNSDGKITNFVLLKTVFRAVDYSDFKPVQDHSVIEFQVPTAVNDYTWYRKYSDGWVEQGGHTTVFTNTASGTGEDKTVSLPVSMLDSNYSVTTTRAGGSSGWSYRELNVNNKATTGFTISEWNNGAASGTTCYAEWQVSGMAA